VAELAHVQQLLKELEPLLATGSMGASELIAQHGKLHKATFGLQGYELVRQIEHFLYEDALATLKAIRER
jgi:hypothetical protein